MRTGYEVYEAYLDGHEGEIERREPFIMEVRDLAEFTRKVVRARVAQPPERLPAAQDLWVRNYKDDSIRPEPWSIEILEELDEEEVKPVRGDVARGELPSDARLY
jgi:hypothetical protein